MASSAWKGFISFGLVSIPIRLYAAARSSTIRLHQVHSVCKTRLKQPLFCPTCNRVVERSEVVKGYEDDDGKYILLDPAEVKAIEPESARNMEILSFVKAAQIDPLFFDSSYFMVAEEQGRKAYQLLLKTLEDSGRVGIAKVTMYQREHTVFIRPYDHGLAVHTMYYENEIREAPGYGKNENIKLNPQEAKLANQLVATLSEDFHVEKYHDEFQARLKSLIEGKQKGKQILHGAPERHRAPVIDMMAALKKSLAATRSPAKEAARANAGGAGRRRIPHRVAS
jgi:DNA end-binding protein Ku